MLLEDLAEVKDCEDGLIELHIPDRDDSGMKTVLVLTPEDAIALGTKLIKRSLRVKL